MSASTIKLKQFVCAKVTSPWLLCVCFGVLLFSMPARAQLNYGRIYGAITDQTSGAMAGATVTVLDVDRGISRSIVADDAGEFSASSLLPGTYTVRAEAKGFKAAEHGGLKVGVGQDVRVDLTLQPGEQTQTVTVTGDVPMVNTTSATLGGTIENATIVDLPLNGRAFQKLLDFNPGMQQVPGGGTPAYNVNGQRGTNITWMLDGVDEINMAGGAGPTVGGNGGGVDGVTILSLDAIQEVNTIQSPKAEYGWMAGSIVNIGLKSGTNGIHGTAFGFLRNGALDAKNAFIGPGLSKATDNLKQYGGTIGGPIKKDKLFYFGAYEGNRYTLGSPKTITEPTDAAGLGTGSSIPDAIAAMNAGGRPLSTMSVLMAGCSLGATNPALKTGAAVAPFCGPGASGAPPSLFGNSTGSATLPVQFNNLGGSDNGLAKIDYHLSSSSTLNGEYFFGNGNVNNATSTISPFWLADNHFRTQTGRVVWVWTPKSSIVNEMRFGLLEYTQLGFPDDCNGHDGAPDYASAYGYNLGLSIPAPQCGMANVVITGFNNLGSQSTNGGPQANHFSVWSGIDSVSYTRGSHLFKFGGEIHDTLFSGSKSLTNDNGTFNFGRVQAFSGASNLQSFLAGVASSGTILAGNATLSTPLNYNRYALFAQDDWRIKPRITLNLGVRYEYVQPVTTPNNVLGNFNVGSPTGLVQEVGGEAVYTLPKDLFSPRFGIAWDVTGKGTTVVRLGGTYMHDFLVFQQLLPNLQNVPTGFALFLPNGALATPQPGNNLLGTLALSGGTSGSQINWSGTGPVVTLTPNSVNSLGFACGNGVGTPAPCNLNPPVTPQNGFKPDGVVAWNLSVQHAFGNNLSLNVAYVGTHGEDLRGTTDINQPSLGIANGSSGAALQNELRRRPFTQNCSTAFLGGLGLNPAQCFPYLGQVQENLPNEISNYNGLQVTLNKRLSHGLQFNAGYTYAHALDMASGLSNSANRDLENGLNPWMDYSNAAFDARHHLTITGTYDIPGYKMKGQMLQGWQVNVASTILSALPFNAQDSTDDLSGTGVNQDRWNILGDPGNFVAGTAAPIPCFGITGSKFAASGTGCTIVPAVANLPAQCVTAAGAAANNPSVPAANNAMGELAALGCYFQNGTAMVPAAQGTYGNMGRNVLRGRPFKETDFSVTKTWKFGERLTTQFRAEFFNIFNAVEFSNPGQNTATANLAAPATFGSASSTPNTFSFIFGSGGPRTAQLGLKFLF
jgi:hypothetical protein